MKTILLFLTRPLYLITLWLSFALFLWLAVDPQAHLTAYLQRIPVQLELIVLTLFILVGSLSFLSAHYSRTASTKLDEQAQTYKALIRKIKKQHNDETHQIRTLVGNEQFAYWEWDIKKSTAHFSPQWKRMVGLEVNTHITNLHDLQKRIHPKDQNSVQQDFFKILSGKEKYLESTHRIKHEGGHYLWVHDKGQDRKSVV